MAQVVPEVGGWRALLAIGPLDWSKVDWLRALRVVVGVVVPFGAGVLSGHLVYGAFAALGALPAGFVSFQGSSRSRLSAIAVASIGMALSTFAGSLAAAYAPWTLVPLVVLLGYGCGLAVCLDMRLSVAALQVAVALEVSVSVPLSLGPAAVRAALVLAGGLLQGVLVLFTWVAAPGSAERQALAASYRALAAYARSLAAGAEGPPSPVALAARSFTEDPNPLLSPGQRLMFVDLLEEAERLRRSLAAMSRYNAPLSPRSPLPGEPVTNDVGALCELYGQTAQLLDQVADALTAPRRRRAAASAELVNRARSTVLPSAVAWRWLAEALLGQLRAVSGIVSALEPDRLALASMAPGEAAPAPSRALGALSTLRANVTTRTEAGRHAVRMAAAAGAAEAIVLASGLAEGRWAVLTLFIVLKPDYANTLYRGVQRAAGTAVGAGLGLVVVELGHLGPAEMTVAAAISVGAAYALFNVSYLLFSTWLTAFVVFLLDILGTPAVASAGERLLNTAIGSAVALVAFAAWPTWEGRTAKEKFAHLLEAHGEYVGAVLTAAAGGGDGRDLDELRRLQLAARRARSDAEASAERMAREPRRPGQLSPDTARALTAAVRRLAAAELVAHTLAEQRARSNAAPGSGPVRASLGSAYLTAASSLASALAHALTAMAAYLRGSGRSLPEVALRPLYDRLSSAGGPDDPLLGAADSMVDVAGSLAAALAPEGAPAPEDPPAPQGAPAPEGPPAPEADADRH